MLHDLNDTHLFPRLSDEEMEYCLSVGEPVQLEDGQIAFKQGEGEYCLHVIVSGGLKVFRYEGQDIRIIAVHGPKEFSGEISMLAGNQSPLVSAKAYGPTKLVRICRDKLRELIAKNAQAGDVILTAMARRAQQLGLSRTQDEKLAALGKMSAGLAHELNNPAAAARRAATLLLEAVYETPRRLSRVDTQLNPTQQEFASVFAATMRDKGALKQLDALDRSDREQEFFDWLEDHGVPHPEEISCTLASTSFTTDDLEEWRQKLGPVFVRALFWAETVTRLSELARDIETSAGRISELVTAMKEYTYMDQAKFQVVDVHKGIEGTLKILHHKLKLGIDVRREFGTNLPTVCAYPGELNQVWTNLIDNAIDAMHGKGILTIRTRLEASNLVVEICDNGEGISEENLTRIFEPFFTTKSVGKGTGLGLDISYRIITNRHGGEIRVRSRPGETCFQVFLPQRPPRESEVVQAAQEARL